ncbi:glycoside hydrolase family 67 protein [Penicillium canariense]|uniref:Glycoside hydrolase family 67 protein n=1 Tax=Penicillium canariense TaxID=189055 RepID=A0A9W9LDZ6_9EURO|nr:glycoside hydrolase family 67 protein [Penicillium canariense]KAJ5150818.1 glycoside hydrolase family 67 protein [Penicillium canariense]
MLLDETGLEAWLRYAALPAEIASQHPRYSAIIALTDNQSSPVYTASKELQLGLSKILVDAWAATGGDVQDIPGLKADGLCLSCRQGVAVKILGQNECVPALVRWVNEWDNLDGTIERGYAGPSIYFKDGYVVDDLTRTGQYARLLASVRLNGIIVNNVNSDAELLNPTNMEGLARIADIMRPWGVRIGVALYFDTPKGLGGLPTSDPLDPGVIAWWDYITTKLYQHVPDMLGYLIKANSEGQPGPLTYGRTLADGANLFARALQKHGDGIVMYRAFVYNYHLDESNWKNDRANAAVEFFDPLDTEYEDNVLVQIKYGPIDFQIREPPSPLLAHLRKTPIILELQVAQEYLGQQNHVVYLPPLWRTILDFDFQIDDKPSLVCDIVSGERFNRSRAGYAAVVNIGNDPTWLGSHLAMSNSTRTAATTGTLKATSGNLGIQTICDIVKTCHFGPSPAAHDGNGWGQWTRADTHALGMDRTVATGTGNAGQYPSAIAVQFEKIETTPDERALALVSSCAVQASQTFPKQWEALRGLIDDARFKHVLFRLRFQVGHAVVWRDSVNTFYHAKCGIEDEQGRVRNHPWRIEAEAMGLDGFEVVSVTPFEAASGSRVIVAVSGVQMATAQSTVPFPFRRL